MKNLFRVAALLFISFIFQPSTLNAQFGIKAGANLSNIKFDGDIELQDSESIVGYQFGLVYNLGIGDKIAIQPEVAFNRTGNKFSNPDIGPNQASESINNHNFLNLSAILHYNLIGNSDGLRLYVLGGGFGEYLLSEQLLQNFGGDIERIKLDLENDEFFDRLNYGITYGVGIGLNSFFVQLRGAVGISDLDDITITDMNGQPNGVLSTRSRDFSLIVGYLF